MSHRRLHLSFSTERGTRPTSVIGRCALLDNPNWVILQARDIADDDADADDKGWIVAYATPNGIDRYVVLLTPTTDCPRTTCNTDIDGDGVTGISDLLVLLTTWGPCGGCGGYGASCPADLDCDDLIGINDLLILLPAWGPCSNPGSEPVPTSIQECLQRYSDPDERAACICIVEPCTAGCPPALCE